MAKDWAVSFYNSKAWKKCRNSYIAKRVAIDGGLCETCQDELGYIVHHEIWLAPENISDPDISLNHDYLKYDCHTCHNKEKETEETPRYIFDATGQPVPYSPYKK